MTDDTDTELDGEGAEGDDGSPAADGDTGPGADDTWAAGGADGDGGDEDDGGGRSGILRLALVVVAFVLGTLAVLVALVPFDTPRADSGAAEQCGPPVFELFAGGQREVQAHIAELCRTPAQSRMLVSGFLLFAAAACAVVLIVRDREERMARDARWLGRDRR